LTLEAEFLKQQLNTKTSSPAKDLETHLIAGIFTGKGHWKVHVILGLKRPQHGR
jgi:hypothetical protein